VFTLQSGFLLGDPGVSDMLVGIGSPA